MIGHCIVIGAEAPNDVVAEFGTIDRQLTLGVKARARQRDVLAATVAVRDEVALLVTRVVTARDP